jgi:hypothetical protein
MKRSLLKLVLDISLAVAFLALMEPRATGLSLHEWGGLLICVAFLIHNLLNGEWILGVTRGFFSHLPARTRLNYILDWLLFIGLVLIVVSGLGIARTIDFSWLPLPENRWLWRSLHGSAAIFTLLVIGGHIGLHWNWVMCQFRSKPEMCHE